MLNRATISMAVNLAITAILSVTAFSLARHAPPIRISGKCCIVCDASLLFKKHEPLRDYRGDEVALVCRDCWRQLTYDERAALSTYYLFGYSDDRNFRLRHRGQLAQPSQRSVAREHFPHGRARHAVLTTQDFPAGDSSMQYADWVVNTQSHVTDRNFEDVFAGSLVAEPVYVGSASGPRVRCVTF